MMHMTVICPSIEKVLKKIGKVFYKLIMAYTYFFNICGIFIGTISAFGMNAIIKAITK